MRNYEYEEKWKKLLTPEIVSYLTLLHEFKGEQRLVANRYADVLTDLVEIAKIQSTESSNKIEGIYTSDERLKKIMLEKTMPKSRNEREIAGYRDVLNTIHENYEHIPLKTSFVLQLHRDLYKFENNIDGGRFKSNDNVIEEEDKAGNRRIRFVPVPAWETPDAMEELCTSYQKALNNDYVEPLIIIPMFILDFLCIHPFYDGNGRMSRLLTLLLLYKSGFIVGKYISIEKLIEKTKDYYYGKLQESSHGWHEEENDYKPFVKYFLSILVAAYREFFERTRLIEEKKLAKPDKVADEIQNHIGTITKTQLLEQLPGVSKSTIEKSLLDLVKQNKIIKIGGGRYTKYVWNWEEGNK